MRKKFTFFVLILFASFISIYSQDTDSTDTDDEWEEWNDQDSTYHPQHWNMNWEWDDFKGKDFFKNPTIGLSYGLAKMNLKDFSGSFADPGLIELKLGYSTLKEMEYDAILKYNYTYLLLSNFSPDLRSSSDNDKINTDMWRFGIGRASGFGYKLGNEAALVPYYSGSLTWSTVDFKDSISNPADNETAELFDEAFRFGTSAEGGIKIKVMPVLTLEAGYERSIIFPRHLFWKWLGSAGIELIGQWALDGFIDNIMDSSPYAVPVVSFVLKNALSYGIYELRQEKMNWPFGSAAPLAYDQFKFGVTFVF